MPELSKLGVSMADVARAQPALKATLRRATVSLQQLGSAIAASDDVASWVKAGSRSLSQRETVRG